MVRIKIKPVGDNNYVGYFSDRDKIGTYLKEKINVFKENMLLVIDKLDDYSYDFDEKASCSYYQHCADCRYFGSCGVCCNSGFQNACSYRAYRKVYSD